MTDLFSGRSTDAALNTDDVGSGDLWVLLPWFHIGFLPGGEYRCVQGCMRMLVHLLDFNEILDIFKDKKRQIQL